MQSLTRLSRVRPTSALKSYSRAYRASLPRRDHQKSRSFFPKLTRVLGYGAVAGIAGASVVLIGAYGFYHTSGIKAAVDTVRPAIAALKTSRSELSQSRPVEAMKWLRQAAKVYVSCYPGAGFIVDKAFDGLDGIVAAHGPEVNDIIARGQDKIQKLIEHDGNEHSPRSVLDVFSILRGILSELKDVAVKAGAPVAERLEVERRLAELGGNTVALFEGIAAKTPEIKAQLAEYARVKGPEVSSKIGEYAQTAKDYAAPKASALYDGAKAQAPGVQSALSTAAEKAKNAIFPPKDS